MTRQLLSSTQAGDNFSHAGGPEKQWILFVWPLRCGLQVACHYTFSHHDHHGPQAMMSLWIWLVHVILLAQLLRQATCNWHCSHAEVMQSSNLIGLHFFVTFSPREGPPRRRCGWGHKTTPSKINMGSKVTWDLHAKTKQEQYSQCLYCQSSSLGTGD